MNRHQRHQENLAPFLLGALPELEAQALERHLMGCEECRDQLAELRPAAHALARAVEPVTPPVRLKGSLMEALARADQDTVESSVASVPGPPPVAADPPPPAAKAGFLQRLRPRVGPLSPALGWIGAALLLAAGVAGGWALTRTADDTDGPRAVAAQVDRSRFTRGNGSLLIPRDGSETAVLRLQGMRPPPPGEVYEIWLKRGGEVEPESLFTVHADGSGLGAIDEELDDVDAVLVTREKAGGAPAPTEQPIVTVELS